MATSHSMYIVDAFTDVPFEGNPAAVCPLKYDSKLTDDQLQKIAMEMNLSETAFPKLLQPDDTFQKGSVFGLRWFLPVEEVKLCGHATLAAAAVLFYKLGNESSSLTFQTLSGDIKVDREGEVLHMDLPTGYTQNTKHSDYEDLIFSLGETPGIQDIVYCSSLKYLLVHFKDGWTRKQFEDMKISMGELVKSNNQIMVLIVTAKGFKERGFVDRNGEAYDFVSRVFAPWVQLPEDPVTGSAQTVLAHYWTSILNKTDFYTRQTSKRGGDIRIKYRDDRVDLFGKATIFMEGKLMI